MLPFCLDSALGMGKVFAFCLRRVLGNGIVFALLSRLCPWQSASILSVWIQSIVPS